MNEKNAPKIPAKWLVIIVFALIAYGLGQPLANRKFGWQLPSLASLLGYKETEPVEAETSTKSSRSPSQKSTDNSKQESTANADEQSDSRGAATAQASNRLASGNQNKSESASELEPQSQVDSTKSTNSQSDKKKSPSGASSKAEAVHSSPTDNASKGSPKSNQEDLHYGILRATGREEFISPAGLRFTKGSDEGHRLKHLERHLEDLPDRPGKHGVFYGDMPQVLVWLDEAYGRAKTGAKGTSTREEEGRTVYEVNFSKPIGYIGGRDGARQKNPDSKRLRMVVDDNRFITAFPF